VEVLRIVCGSAVDAELFSPSLFGKPRGCCATVQIRTAFRLRDTATLHHTDRGVNTVRFEETIHGRSYIIEVSPVDRDRWRAQILRRPGASTALMPFYGATALEAAALLSQWLTRAAGTRS
jgi:hypothetical protein